MGGAGIVSGHLLKEMPFFHQVSGGAGGGRSRDGVWLSLKGKNLL